MTNDNNDLLFLLWETFKDWFLNEISISILSFGLLFIALWSYLS